MTGTNGTAWAAAPSPHARIAQLRRTLGRRAERPLAFFAVHLARLALPAMSDARSRHALDVAELHLIGLATAEQLAAAATAADAARADARQAQVEYGAGPVTRTDHDGRAVRMSDALGAHVAFHAAATGFYDGMVAHARDALAFRHPILGDGPYKAFGGSACRILRELSADPAATPAFRPEWRTETAVLLARQMLAANDFGAMPILADALQDAGCDAGVLAHCRDAAHAHLRGCWALEMVLGLA